MTMATNRPFPSHLKSPVKGNQKEHQYDSNTKPAGMVRKQSTEKLLLVQGRSVQKKRYKRHCNNCYIYIPELPLALGS